jgi:hypothetical protein
VKDIIVDQFQFSVSELLVRNKSVLDTLTKYQESNARVNRSIMKAVTQCGCISINASKQNYQSVDDFEEMKNSMKTHIDGTLCENCRDLIEKDIGRNLFYLASLCNTLDLNLIDIVIKEQERLKILGKYNLR